MKGFRRGYHQDICRISEITPRNMLPTQQPFSTEHRTEEAHPLRGAQGTYLDIDHGTYPYVTSYTVSGNTNCGSISAPTNVHQSYPWHMQGLYNTGR